MNIFNMMTYEQFESNDGEVHFRNGAIYKFDLSKFNKNLYYLIAKLVWISPSSLQIDMHSVEHMVERNKV